MIAPPVEQLIVHSPAPPPPLATSAPAITPPATTAPSRYVLVLSISRTLIDCTCVTGKYSSRARQRSSAHDGSESDSPTIVSCDILAPNSTVDLLSRVTT